MVKWFLSQNYNYLLLHYTVQSIDCVIFKQEFEKVYYSSCLTRGMNAVEL